MDIRGFFAKPPGAAKKEAAEKAAAEPIDLDVASSPAPAAKKEDKKKRKAGAESAPIDVDAPAAAKKTPVTSQSPSKKAVKKTDGGAPSSSKRDISADDFFEAGGKGEKAPEPAPAPKAKEPAAKKAKAEPKAGGSEKRKASDADGAAPAKKPAVKAEAAAEAAAEKPKPKPKAEKAAAAAPPSDPSAAAPDAPAAPPPPRKWYPGMKEDRPVNKGAKRVPKGTAQCLGGMTMVITGQLDSLEREECQALIERHGGRVTGSVSGKTTYVIAGIDADTGERTNGSKVQKATKLGTKIIDEDGLFELIAASRPQTPEPVHAPAACSSSKSEMFYVDTTDGTDAAPPAAFAAGAGSSGASAAVSAPPKPKAKAKDHDGAPPLWAEKYRPDSLGHLAGNQDHCKRLSSWVTEWARNARVESDGGEAKGWHRAALLSGPPGIGKTSCAKVVLAQCGYDVVEYNASDTRSKKALEAAASDLVSNTSIADFASGASGGVLGRKMALIMDEVDGMSSGDRGGMAQLITLIKRARMPVVCICNDRQDQKVRSLANHCLDLRFTRPGSIQVANVLKRVAASEGYDVDFATLERIAEAAQCDIRQTLNLLQMWRPKGGAGLRLTKEEVQKEMGAAFKDIDVGPFDVAARLFAPGAQSLDGRLRHYFVDSSMMPLMVQESYLNSNWAGVSNDALKLQRASLAADAIASADVLGKRIVSEQLWSLSQAHGALSCVAPGFYAQGVVGRPTFPQWLGRNSTATKRQRLLREISGHLGAKVSASKDEVRASYVSALRGPLLTPLAERGADGIDDVIGTLDDYGLTKDDFDSIMELELLPKKTDKSAFTALPSSVKSALTRKYNKAHAAVKKGSSSKGGGAGVERYTEDDEDRFIDDGEEGEEEEDDVVAKPKKAAAKGKGKGKAKA